MKKILSVIPYPIAGLVLAIAVLGNLLGNYSNPAKGFCGIIAGTLFVLIVLKLIVMPESFVEAIKMPPVASVLTTFPMGMIILSGYFAANLPIIAKGFWWIGIAIYLYLMIEFTRRHALPFKQSKVLVSYFVTYIGLVVITVTAKPMGFEVVGQIAWYFGLLAYILLLPIVIGRLLLIKDLPAPVQPLSIIFAAPANLLLVGYLKGMPNANIWVVSLLLVIGLTSTVYALFLLPNLLKLPFFPSYAAFTFPFVIGAVASRGAFGFLLKKSIELPLLDWVAYGQMLIASGMVGYVAIRYTLNISKQIKQKAK